MEFFFCVNYALSIIYYLFDFQENLLSTYQFHTIQKESHALS